MFRLEKERDLPRITPPPEFRVNNPKNANPNGFILSNAWPPPCPVLRVTL
jgi:hypothetical protein